MGVFICGIVTGIGIWMLLSPDVKHTFWLAILLVIVFGWAGIYEGRKLDKLNKEAK